MLLRVHGSATIHVSSNSNHPRHHSSLRVHLPCNPLLHTFPEHNDCSGGSSGTRGAHLLSSNSTRAARVACKDAPRPMWAAKSSTPAAGALPLMITKSITQCDSVTALSDVQNEWGGSFNFIHASAALVKCSKLPWGARSTLEKNHCSIWLQQLPLSDLQGCSNVLWACARLGPTAVERVWGRTWETYVKQVQHLSVQDSTLSPQQISNALWACAKLRKQPAAGDLELLVQAFLRPDVLATAAPQEVSNVMWALSELHRLPGWCGGVSEVDVQQLLGQPQLQALVAGGTPQAAANVMLALARLAGAEHPLVSAAFANACCQQLQGASSSMVSSWKAQDITTALWVSGQLGSVVAEFLEAAVASAPRWLPGSTWQDVNQAVSACVGLCSGIIVYTCICTRPVSMSAANSEGHC